MDAIAVVGDVHGDVRRLRAMLRELEPFLGRIIFVGDYVNGGPDSADVIETLAALSKNDPERFVFLLGNHDVAFLRYLEDANFALFAATGGLATLASYLPLVTGDVHAALRAVFPAHHMAFLRGLAAFWQSEDYLVSHTGFDPARPDARGVETMAHPHGWPIFSATSYPTNLVICGHYVQSGVPYESAHLICVDTGCGILPDAPLTAVLLPERRFISLA